MARILSELGRATIIGQQTVGAAHSVTLKRVNSQFVMQVPIGLTTGPVTRTDFEGVGVEPHIEVPSHAALTTARKLALKAIDPGKTETDIAWDLRERQAPAWPTDEMMRDRADIIGTYDGREIFVENGQLIYRWLNRYSLALTPIGGGLFAVQGEQDYRFRIVRENGKVFGVRRELRDGNSSFHGRSE